MKLKGKILFALMAIFSMLFILVSGTTTAIASDTLEKRIAFDITTKIFKDGKLISSPRIVTYPNEEAIINLSNNKEAQEIKMRLIAENQITISKNNRIGIKYDIDYQDESMKMHTNPQIVVEPNQEAKIKLSSSTDHVFELVILANTKSDGDPLKESLKVLLADHLYLVTKNQRNGYIRYTRKANFKFDKASGLIYRGNYNLAGYALSNSKELTDYVDIKIPVEDVMPPSATTTMFMTNTNLSSIDAVPSDSLFNPTDPCSYNLSSTGTIYDSNGDIYPCQFYYVKTAAINTWEIYVWIQGTVVATGKAIFYPDGSISQIIGLDNITVHLNNKDQTVKLNLSNITQNANVDNPGMTIADGNSIGTYSSFAIDRNGMIGISYSNGMKKAAFQIGFVN